MNDDETMSSDATEERFYFDTEYSLRMEIIEKDKKIARLIYAIEKYVVEIERLKSVFCDSRDCEAI